MSSASRSRASTVLLCLMVIAAQSWGTASAWGGLWSVTAGGGREQKHAEAESGVQTVVPGGVHRVPAPAGAADLQLRRSEQERAVTRTSLTAARRGRFLSDAAVVQAINVWPTSLRYGALQTCDITPSLCESDDQVAIGATTCCNKKCVNTSTDKNNCGACSVKVGHGCVCCSGISANLKKDVNNCGKCGNKCLGPNPVCSYSICNYNTAP